MAADSTDEVHLRPGRLERSDPELVRLPAAGAVRNPDRQDLLGFHRLAGDQELRGGRLDVGGRTVQAKLQVAFKTAALIPGTLAVSKSSVQLPTANGSAVETLNITLPGDEAWSASVFPANPRSSWLKVSPASGRGPAQLTLIASESSLPAGVYTATVIVQSEYMTPQFVEVPVVFLLGVSAGGTITGAQNAASFKPVFAPGMLMSLYGTNLANSTQAAKSMPLPRNMDGVTVAVNGLPAPLWFVSPGQINVQIPYETTLGTAVVIVNNNGQVSGYTIEVARPRPASSTMPARSRRRRRRRGAGTCPSI